MTSKIYNSIYLDDGKDSKKTSSVYRKKVKKAAFVEKKNRPTPGFHQAIR